MTVTDLTLGQAARLSGRGKTTLARAIKGGRMSATRRDDGGYLVNVAELERVFGPLNGATVAATGDVAHHATPDATALIEAEHRADLAEARLADLRAALEDMRTQRDKWEAVATRLTLRSPEPEKMTWWRWLRTPAA